MNYLFACVFLVAVVGCEQKPQPRQYTEEKIEAPQAAKPPMVAQGADPHAGLDMSGAMGGEDPHAGLDMSGAMGGQDPHAGLDMGNAMTGTDPHAGLDMSSAAPMMAAAGGHKAKLAWSVPQGWTEEPGKGMRVATFHATNNPQEIDVSIVSLGGMAGGLESNIKRWMGQIGVQASDEQFQKFIQAAKDNIFDFTWIQKGQPPATKSMVAAILTLGDSTVFVKMTGSIDAVTKHKNELVALAGSVHTK